MTLLKVISIGLPLFEHPNTVLGEFYYTAEDCHFGRQFLQSLSDTHSLSIPSTGPLALNPSPVSSNISKRLGSPISLNTSQTNVSFNNSLTDSDSPNHDTAENMYTPSEPCGTPSPHAASQAPTAGETFDTTPRFVSTNEDTQSSDTDVELMREDRRETLKKSNEDDCRFLPHLKPEVLFQQAFQYFNRSQALYNKGQDLYNLARKAETVAKFSLLTMEEEKRLSKLASNKDMAWDEIQPHFPDKSISVLSENYNARHGTRRKGRKTKGRNRLFTRQPRKKL
jgi:hypothetical protein